MDTKSCPFCGEKPEIQPINPLLQGDAWGSVKCENEKCWVNPEAIAFVEYNPIDIAIKRWNQRL